MQNNIPYVYIVKKYQQIFPNAQCQEKKFIKQEVLRSWIQSSVMQLWSNDQFCFSTAILRRRKTSGKQKNYHTIRKNVLKITSMEEYANYHFNEINMLLYPQTKKCPIPILAMVSSSSKKKSPFLLMWAILKLQQLLEFQSRRRGGTRDAFSLWDISAYFLSVSDSTVSGKQSLTELPWDSTPPQLFKQNPPDGGKIQP